MRTSTVLAALSLFTSAFAQGVAEGIAPSGSYPDGCEGTVRGNFTIGTLIISSKQRRESAENVAANTLVCTLEDGILHDAHSRTGSIVSNYQFQFDGPPQAGAIWTGGWSICSNNSMAIGPNTTFYHCMSGGFANIYSENLGAQCTPINIIASFVDEPSSSSSSSVASSTTVASSSHKSSTGSASASISASTSASISASTSASKSASTSESSSGSSSGTASTSVSASATASADTTTTVAAAPDATAASGAAVPTRAPRREMFGAVVGILGAALIL